METFCSKVHFCSTSLAFFSDLFLKIQAFLKWESYFTVKNLNKKFTCFNIDKKAKKVKKNTMKFILNSKCDYDVNRHSVVLKLKVSKNFHFMTPQPPLPSKCLRNIWTVPKKTIMSEVDHSAPANRAPIKPDCFSKTRNFTLGPAPLSRYLI